MKNDLHGISVKTSNGKTKKYKWCLTCERTYKKGEFREVHDELFGKTLKMCPYEGCNGDAVMRCWDWETVRRDREDRYPEVPVKGKVYPLYE